MNVEEAVSLHNERLTGPEQAASLAVLQERSGGRVLEHPHHVPSSQDAEATAATPRGNDPTPDVDHAPDLKRPDASWHRRLR